MNAAELIDYLTSITAISPDCRTALEHQLKTESYKAHQVIHAAGQTENRLWYVASGFARSYYFDPSGKEHTLAFYSERDIIFSHQGYWQEATDYYIEVLELTAVISLSYDQLKRLLEVYPEIRTLTQVFVRHRYQQELFKSRMMSWAAEERYRQLRRLNPELFRRTSVRLIATYLNMTRENLSRLIAGDR